MKKISRHYTDEALIGANIETRIAIYEDRIRGWFHDQARILEKASDHCGYVLLMVAISYIEGHAMFLRGESSKGKSQVFFNIGFKDVFKCENKPPLANEDEVIKEIYDQVRSGLFHHGMTKGKVRLSGEYDKSIHIRLRSGTSDVLVIELNPHRMLDTIEQHLSRYVCRLRDPKEKELRQNFEEAWKLTR